MVPVPVNTPGVVEFNMARDAIWMASQAVLVGVLLVLAFSGAAARIERGARRLVQGRGYPARILAAGAVLAIAAMTVLPFAVARDFGLAAAWGRNVPAWGPWLSGRAIGLGTQIAAAAALLWLPPWLVRRWPRGWWLVAGTAATLLVTVALVTEQVVIRPMTTRFVPLALFDDATLRGDIQALLRRCQAADADLRIGGGDNTVVGLGPTSRILIAAWAPKEKTHDQLLFTVAHELKHYRMHDNWLAIATVAALIFAGLATVHFACDLALRRLGARIGAATLSDPAALPLAIAVVILFWTLIGLPVLNGAQRAVEWEADRFALEATHLNAAHARWQLRTAERSGGVVDFYPFYRLFHANHPSEAERVRFANSYRPWAEGRPGAYAGACTSIGN